MEAGKTLQIIVGLIIAACFVQLIPFILVIAMLNIFSGVMTSIHNGDKDE
jgi:hypothetical protein